MMLLSEKHPAVLAFAVYKTSNKFSAMAIDQFHEQNSAVIKESGGAVGLTNNSDAPRLWKECRGDINHSHHEEHLGVQAAFMKDVRSLTAVFEEMENPFLDESQDVMYLTPGISWTLM